MLLTVSSVNIWSAPNAFLLRDLARALRLGGEVIAPTDLGAASARLLTVQCHRDLYYTPFPFVPLRESSSLSIMIHIQSYH